MARGARRAGDVRLLRSFFKRVYANGEFLPLVPSWEMLRTMEERLKASEEGIACDIADFLKACGLDGDAEKALNFGAQDAGYLLLEKKLREGRPHLRPMELHECAVAKTVAALYGMSSIWSKDMDSSPGWLTAALQRVNNADRSVAEYIYYAPRDEGSSLLMLLGGPNTTDMLLSKTGGSVRIEAKGQLSKLGEYDFPDVAY